LNGVLLFFDKVFKKIIMTHCEIFVHMKNYNCKKKWINLLKNGTYTQPTKNNFEQREKTDKKKTFSKKVWLALLHLFPLSKMNRVGLYWFQLYKIK